MHSPHSPQPPASPDAEGSQSGKGIRRRKIRVVKEQRISVEHHRQVLRMRLAIAGAAVALIALVITVLTLYPRTSHFNSRLGDLLHESTGATVKSKNLALSATRATADDIEFTWPESSRIASLNVRRLVADVSVASFIRGGFGGDDVRAASGTLWLRQPDSSAPSKASDEKRPKNRIHFDRLAVTDLDIFFGDQNSPISAEISGAEATFYPSGPKGHPRVLLASGTLKIPYWPDLTIERALIEFPEGNPEIVGMRVRPVDSKVIPSREPQIAEISGLFPLETASPSSLEFNLKSFPLESLHGEEDAKIIAGEVVSATQPEPGMIVIEDGRIASLRTQVRTSPQDVIRLQRFPFLSHLSSMLVDRWFSQPYFDADSNLTVFRDDSGVRFESLKLTHANLMTVRGDIFIDSDQEISGKLEIGIAAQVLERASLPRLSAMFSSPRDGMSWTQIELGGTTHMPLDDFNARFIETPLPPSAIPRAPVVADPETDE